MAPVSAKKKAQEASGEPRSYGRQGPEKTIKTVSLDKKIAKWADKQAKKLGISTSAFVNNVLAKESGVKPEDQGG